MDQRNVDSFDAVVVGAGIAGMYMLHKLRGAGFSVRGFDTASDVGGTWYWNRYPGARCDGESMQYSYSFDESLQQEWEWTERFASQPEILRYLGHVADRFGLRRDFEFSTTVAGGDYREDDGRWTVRIEGGRTLDCQFMILATGCLSVGRVPELEGADTFAGLALHTGSWPHEPVDFTGKRIGIIGTGSSGVQLIPVAAETAAHLTVFQRTPAFTLPARNGALTAEEISAHKARYPELRALARVSGNGTLRETHDASVFSVDDDVRLQRFRAGWEKGGTTIFGSFNDLARDEAANDLLAGYVKDEIRAIVRDEAKAVALTAQDYPIGAKRPTLGTDYYETFNRDDVTLVDLRSDPIVRVEPTGLRTESALHELDMLVYATGFDAMTGSFLRIDVRGVGGRRLRDDWAGGPHTYLGLAVSGYPNLFLVTGPGSPSVLGNVVVSIEQHVEWIAKHFEYLNECGYAVSEADFDAQENWVAHVNDTAAKTLFVKAASWYLGANIPGKPQVFMPYPGGFGNYREICDKVAANDYDGFVLR